MKLWITGLALIIIGLLAVPASYFLIILNNLPQTLNIVLFIIWVLGFVAVPVGFLMIIASAVRYQAAPADAKPEGPGAPDGRGLIIIAVGLVLVPLSYFAIIWNDFSRPVNVVLGVFWLIGFLAVPAGFVMLIVSAVQNGKRQRLEGSAVDTPAARTSAVAAGQGAAGASSAADEPDLLSKLDDLREAGVVTDTEYQAKKQQIINDD